MHHVKYLVLGSGPSGLAFAHALADRGEQSFLVLEKEVEAGGLCRSQQVDGAALDIGGGHFLDVKRAAVLELLFRFLPRTEWAEYNRVARIRLRGQEIDHPLEGNLWQFPVPDQIAYLESISQAGAVQGGVMPEAFEPWIRWKFGDLISDDYMLPYNRKIWSMPLEDLGTYWLEKLPSVSFRETLESCLTRKPGGQLPAHGRFLYPRNPVFGYGEVWRRMGERLGRNLRLSTPVTAIDPVAKIVNGCFRYDQLVSTVPWPLWLKAAKLPEMVGAAIRALRHVPIDVDYSADSSGSEAHWIYEPDPAVTYHRILARENFVPGARGQWTETNATRNRPAASNFRHHNPYAYPANTLHKREHMLTILAWARENHILPLGRWGLWEHVNSDVAVEQAMLAAAALSNGT